MSKFRTRIVKLNLYDDHDDVLTTNLGTRANLNYLDQLAKFHKQHGTNLTRFPSVDKRPLDLYKLKKAVDIRGGFDQVCKLKKWAEIGRDLGYSGKIMSSLSTSLKNSYQRWLQPYEEYLLVAKPGVQHQLEIEHGGPLEPSLKLSPASKKTDENEKQSPEVNGDTPAENASAALNASISASVEPDRKELDPADIPAPGPATTSGFTAVNAQPNAFQTPGAVKQEADNDVGSSNRTLGGKTLSPAANLTPDRNSEGGSSVLENGHGSHSLKRTQSHDSRAESPFAANGDMDASNGRRSKRLKKGRPFL